ncbi:MAG: RidA family protein [Chloroflexi bacterium]|nr:RidA family protein [Chloroflexota bacterium]
MDLQPVKTASAPIPRGPYNQAVRVGDTIYVAGQMPLDPATNMLVEGDAAAQARRVFENIKAIVEAAGSSMDRVVKTTIFLTDVADFAAVNAVYAEFFTGTLPARSTVGVAALPGGGARLQVDAIAIA